MRELLQRARETRGLSLRQVSQQTGIPVDILAAIEAEESAALAPGGIVARYRRQYEVFLEISSEERAGLVPLDPPDLTVTESTVTDPLHEERVPLARLMTTAVLVVAVALLALWVAATVADRSEQQTADAEEEPAPLPDQTLAVRAHEPTRVIVYVDGVRLQDGIIPPRTTARFEGDDRMSVYVPDLTRVRVSHNGRGVTPLGNLSKGRTLVFIDDLEP